MNGTAKKPTADLAIVFGGKPAPGGAPPPRPLMGGRDDEKAEGMPDDESAEGEDQPPPEFGVHVREAFPDLGDAQVEALYRAIRSCGSY